MSRNYEEAIELLNTRPREVSNAHMREWLQQIRQNASRFPVIHITGTKGKGSTAAYVDALLRARFHHDPDDSSMKELKIGLYTSPHLVTERERIRINFECISEELFARCLFEVWDAVTDAAVFMGSLPGYHQLVMLTSILAFGYEHVDVVIYEVHCGGRNDATNIFEASEKVACGFTVIALDHIGVLGHSVSEVAWHKSGIMRHETPCFSIVQDEAEAEDMLRREATNLGCPLDFVPTRKGLPEVPKLEAVTQRMNLSLAIELSNAYIRFMSCGEEDRPLPTLSAENVAQAVDMFNWPGRFQRLESGQDSWFLDSAHNAISLPVAMKWYAAEVRSSAEAQKKKVLMFGHQTKRDSGELLSVISKSCVANECSFDAVVMVTYKHDGSKVWTGEDVATARLLLGSSPQFMIAPSVQVARTMLRTMGGRQGVKALVTGSVYIVGETLAELGV